MSVSPPVITAQPSNQIISQGNTATLSVGATSLAPLSYQWYQGQSGDTSNPIEGAASSSFMTPPLNSTTSYWVLVSNVAGSVNSNTATVTVTPALAPVCALNSFRGTETSDFLKRFTVSAMISCIDPQHEPLTTSVDWGDGTIDTKPVGAFSDQHTYKVFGTYLVQVTSTNISGLQGHVTPSPFLTLIPTSAAPPPIFAGQSTKVTVLLTQEETRPAGLQVQFECTTVTDSNGKPHQASELGIDCNSIPPTITFTASLNGQSVPIEIHTSGAASGSLVPGMKHRTWFYAFWLPLPALVLLGGGFSVARSSRRGIFHYVALGSLLVLLLLSFTSCGGGFTAPKITQATPAGDYQVTVIDQPDPSVTQKTTGFVQTSLIVPLTVLPFQ
jgi:Ig-like domain CHU_C associated